MQVTLHTPTPRGSLRAFPSKSEAHRALICAALADAPTKILCTDTNDDIDATIDCLCVLGADITRTKQGFLVTPIAHAPAYAQMDARESGSTLRFLLPVIAALGTRAHIARRGRLPARPLSPLRELLEQNGVSIAERGDGLLEIAGKLIGHDFSMTGEVSSQFVSGLLFALPLLNSYDDCHIHLLGQVASRPYIDMTLGTLAAFGIRVQEQDGMLRVPAHSRYTSPGTLPVGGDWSGAAAFACMGALGKHPITMTDIHPQSLQGDSAILSILSQMGADVQIGTDKVTVSPAPLHGTEIDATDIPDLVPVLAATAVLAQGKTRIYGASRLRLKESNRLFAITEVLRTLGADITETDDGLIIVGKPTLTGGRVSSLGDHRIAMCAAVASLGCACPVTVENAQAITKSYPTFWEQLSALCTPDSVIL